jgi:hypothetical protein
LHFNVRVVKHTKAPRLGAASQEIGVLASTTPSSQPNRHGSVGLLFRRLAIHQILKGRTLIPSHPKKLAWDEFRAWLSWGGAPHFSFLENMFQCHKASCLVWSSPFAEVVDGSIQSVAPTASAVDWDCASLACWYRLRPWPWLWRLAGSNPFRPGDASRSGLELPWSMWMGYITASPSPSSTPLSPFAIFCAAGPFCFSFVFYFRLCLLWDHMGFWDRKKRVL